MSDTSNDPVVEEIIAKRIKTFGPQYFVKWEGSSEPTYTWEYAQFLDCPELIQEFESRSEEKNEQPKEDMQHGRKRKHSDGEDDKPENTPNENATDQPNNSKRRAMQSEDRAENLEGFDHIPEKILGASQITGELTFMIKFKEHDRLEMVPSRIANVKWPLMVIEYYEDNMRMFGGDDDDQSL